VSDEQLNSAQVALADGIAERVVSAIRRDQDRTPERILQQEMARQMVAALHKDGTLNPLTKFGAGRNRGPPLDEDQPAAMTIPEFCAWAKISRSTLYVMWSDGVGPKFFKAGTTTRISRMAAAQWLVDREAASATEAAPKTETAA
jgi:hypothetical protein